MTTKDNQRQQKTRRNKDLGIIFLNHHVVFGCLSLSEDGAAMVPFSFKQILYMFLDL
ncbi:hypothetical protein SCQ05_04285 [Legionella pneumophila serogroup 1]|nr:hypothetical protein [Legionella pneumophila]